MCEDSLMKILFLLLALTLTMLNKMSPYFDVMLNRPISFYFYFYFFSTSYSQLGCGWDWTQYYLFFKEQQGYNWEDELTLFYSIQPI